MKFSQTFLLLSFLGGCNSHSFLQSRDQTIDSAAATLNATLATLADQLLTGQGSKSINDVEKEMMRHMDAKEAARRLHGKLPAEVASLLGASGAPSNTNSQLDDGKIERAILILNGMVEEAWIRLDIKVTECKEFESRNRDTYEQVMIDLARLGSWIAEAEGDRSTALSDIIEANSQIKLIKSARREALAQYTLIKNRNTATLLQRENERVVWNFIMQITNCDTFGDTYKANTLLQVDKDKMKPKVCMNANHEYGLFFDDPRVEKKLEGLMTPDARKTLNLLLSKQTGIPVPANASAPEAMVYVPTIQIQPNPVVGGGQWKKCGSGEPDCGLLHDVISLHWGGYRDLVDMLKQEMAANDLRWSIMLAGFNDQLRIQREALRRANKDLADAIRRINTYTEEKNKKNEERRILTIAYEKQMKICKTEISEILFTFICGVKVTRDVLVTQHTTITVISDCDVTDWNPAECSVPCDDMCPVLNDPNSCGGTHMLSREVINIPLQWGINCPALNQTRRCNQKKCPVDCVMSIWGGWSDCSKVCGGGMQGRTRNILIMPLNGGSSCEADAAEQACNTHSCDLDCLLSDWTMWSGCSQACAGGGRFRRKVVTRAIRGNGVCPTSDSSDRYETETCNLQQCYGDEICIAFQDLVIAIDASGSLKEVGFKAVQKFARNMTARMRTMYYGRPAMKIGVVGFGNGKVSTAGDIDPAKALLSMSSDIAVVQSTIASFTYQAGFTNMAQALVKADEVMTQRSRQEAFSGILLITDGKPSLVWHVEQKIKALKAKNTVIFAAVISPSATNKAMTQMQSWVTSPWDHNLIRIPSWQALEADPEMFASQAIAKFCPYAISPTQQDQNDKLRKFMLLYEGGYPIDECGEWVWLGFPGDAHACYRAARAQGDKAFAAGKDLRLHGCYTEKIVVDQTKWDAWKLNRENPEACDAGSLPSSWVANPYYDTYIMNPEYIEATNQLDATQ